MPIPLRQNLRVGHYLWQQRRAKREKFPLLVEIEPLLGTVPTHVPAPDPASVQVKCAANAEPRVTFAVVGEVIVIVGASLSTFRPDNGPIVVQFPDTSQTVRCPVDAFAVSVPTGTDVVSENDASLGLANTRFAH